VAEVAEGGAVAVATGETDTVVVNQATAMAESLIPQIAAGVGAKLEPQIDAQIAAAMRQYGVIDEEGQITRPPQEDARRGPFASFGEQLQAIASAARSGGRVDSRLLDVNAAVTGMSEGVPADGGFLLQDAFADDIFQLMHETGQVYNRITRRITLSGNSNSLKMPAIDGMSRADGSRMGGVTAAWVAEGETITASAPSFARIALELNKLVALSYATNEQLQDTPVIEQIIRDGFASEMGFELDEGGINGTGVGQPLGILNADATVSIAKETGQAAATIVFENIVNMWARLWAKSRPNAVWFINQSIEPQLQSMSLAVGTGGVPVYLPAGGLSTSGYGSLMGRPVIPIEQCSALGTVGDIILADMSQYWEINKGGVQSASSIHVAFTTDQSAFRATLRDDYRPMWLSALTPFKDTAKTLSPFVTLATRS